MFKQSVHYKPGLYRSLLLASVLSLAACSSSDDNDTDAVDETPQAQENTINVSLSPAQEVPSISVEGASASAALVVDDDSGAISGTLNVSGLTGAPTMAHLHAGFAGTNGPVLFGLDGSDDGQVWTVPADTVLTSEQLQMLLNGGTYLNVHTEANPAGEVRGQVLPSNIEVYRTTLTGAQEVPAVNASGTAVGVLTVNADNGAIWANVTTDLQEPVTMVHIHQGEAGTNGPVAVGLSQDVENQALWTTVPNDTLDVDSLAALETAGLYFNVHTEANPAGEVRGQIGGTMFTVTIENVSNDQTLPTSQGSVAVPLSPGAYIVHRADRNPLLDPRAPAGTSLEALAEDGDASGFPAEVPGSVVFNTPVGDDSPGPIFPGGSYQFSFSAAPGDRLAIATMFVQSNDWFYSTTDADDDSISLFENGQPVSGDVSDRLTLWETETELDEEPGTGPNQAPRQPAPNTGIDETGTVGSLAGKGKSVELNGQVIRVTITPDA